jgi:hypothetical protein
MNKLLKQLFLFSVAILSITLISWGVKGHRTIAIIAEKHLSTHTANVVFTNLKGENMIDASTWADEIRNQPEYQNTSSWHFLNLPLGLTREQFVDVVGKQPGDNVYTAILKAEDNLKDQTLSIEQKRDALKFLIHLVGDAHQPMHISRKEDKGGNTIQVRFDDKGINLHSLWDSKLIDHEGLSDTEMARQYDNAAPVQIQQWQNDSPIQWLWESYQISSQLYTDVDKNKNIDEVYYKHYIPVIHQRIEQAGIRLAGVLNKLLKDTPAITGVSSAPVSALDKPTVITLQQVKNAVGKNVIVEGKVYSSKDIGSMVLINLGAAYPNQLLTVALKGKAKSLANQINDKIISVEGTIVEYKGKPELIITDPEKCKTR